jgi:hypothetical protein
VKQQRQQVKSGQGQIADDLAQTSIFPLPLLQLLGLLNLESPEFLAPAEVGMFRDTDGLARPRNAPALRQDPLRSPNLAHALLGRLPDLCHVIQPLMNRPEFLAAELDRFKGGRLQESSLNGRINRQDCIAADASPRAV